jgi:hypothetical protein
MSPKKKNEAVVAICVQELAEDGSELNINSNLTHEEVLFLHQAFLADTLVNVLGMNDVDFRLFYGDFPETQKGVDTIIGYLQKKLSGKKARALNENLRISPLPPERWGLKMERVFKDCFDEGYRYVLFIGSRTPTLKESLLKMALKMLKKSDAVFGPTVIGRYYLLGLSGKYHVELSGFDWRSPNIYSQVAECFNEKGLSWSEMEMWYTIEQPEDLEFLARDINQFRFEGDEISAKETEMVLRRVLERQA